MDKMKMREIMAKAWGIYRVNVVAGLSKPIFGICLKMAWGDWKKKYTRDNRRMGQDED